MKHKGTVVLNTDRLKLRAFHEDDAVAVYNNWASDPQVSEFLPWSTHQSIADSETILSSWLPQYERKNFYQWGIEVNHTNRLIGSITVVKTQERNACCEVGYCIGQEFWNQGYTSEALNAVLDFLLVQVGYERVEAVHQEENSASGKVMLKAGMTFEGIKRHGSLNKKGEFVNLALYSVIRHERS